MVDTVIFDFDGTLANTNQVIINSFKHIYSVFKNEECNEDYIVSTFGEPLELTLRRDFNQFNYEEVLKCYREYQVEKFSDEVALYETVEETLEYLKSNNIKLGVVTSRMRESVLSALSKFEIAKYFDVIIAADDVKKHKPDKEPLIKALTELNREPESSLYVGDTKFDIECAINANSTPVLVGWHDNIDVLVEKYDVKYVLDKMWDLVKIV